MASRLGALVGLALILHGQAAVLLAASSSPDHACACRQRVCECSHSRPQPKTPSCHGSPAPLLSACGSAQNELAPAVAVPYLLPLMTTLVVPPAEVAPLPTRVVRGPQPPPRLSTPPPKADRHS